MGFLWEMSVGGTGVLSGNIPNNSRINDGLLAPIAVTHFHQYYRIFSSAVLHGSIIHIGVNMLSLFWLGRFIEAVLGSRHVAGLSPDRLIPAPTSPQFYFRPRTRNGWAAIGAIFRFVRRALCDRVGLGERGGELGYERTLGAYPESRLLILHSREFPGERTSVV